MKTINLEFARNKTRPIDDFLQGLEHIPCNPLAYYHAAKAVTNANLRTGTERRCAAVKKAVKQFNVMVSITSNERGLPTVRLYSPIKQIEILL